MCGKWRISLYDPLQTRVLDYLTSLFERGLRYDAINTTKSAMSAIVTPKNGISLGSQPLISRLMKGIFKSRPPASRYESTWDVQHMLLHLVSVEARGPRLRQRPFNYVYLYKTYLSKLFGPTNQHLLGFTINQLIAAQGLQRPLSVNCNSMNTITVVLYKYTWVYLTVVPCQLSCECWL